MQNLYSLANINRIDVERLHPMADKAHLQMFQEADRLGIALPSFHEYTNMSSYIFTYHEVSFERLLTIGLLNNLLFWIDDTLDRNKSNTPDFTEKIMMFEAAINVLKGKHPASHSHPVLMTCELLSERFNKMASQEWLKRFINHTYRHLNASTYDIDDIMNVTQNYSVQDYIEHRDMDSGMEAEIDLIEFAYDFTLPDYVRDHAVLKEARKMTMRIGGLMNDMFSYEKEVIKLNSGYNLLAVISKQSLDIVEAVDYASQLINSYTNTFLSLEDSLPVFEDEALNESVRLYYQGLRDQINGTWHWQFSGTNRYKSPTSPFKELRI